MTTQHTQGPWKIDEDRGGDICIIAANEWEVCTVWEDPNQYDARLIAAAPELLKCLMDYEAKTETEIQAVIAKATGAV